VIITGFGTVPSAVEAVKLGVAAYIEKPFTPQEITDAIARALAAVQVEDKPRIQADLVRDVLRSAAGNAGFGERLRTEGSRVLSGLALSPAAKAAIVSGDIVWIEKECGELSAEERAWLESRLEAETW
jgi:DNA-binding response OmpR family regulator